MTTPARALHTSSSKLGSQHRKVDSVLLCQKMNLSRLRLVMPGLREREGNCTTLLAPSERSSRGDGDVTRLKGLTSRENFSLSSLTKPPHPDGSGDEDELTRLIHKQISLQKRRKKSSKPALDFMPQWAGARARKFMSSISLARECFFLLTFLFILPFGGRKKLH